VCVGVTRTMCIIRPAVPQFNFADLFDLRMHPPEARCTSKDKSIKDSPRKREGDVFTVCTQCKRILVPARKSSVPALRVSSDDDLWMSFEDISISQVVPIANLSHGLCAACFQRMDALVDAIPPSFPTPTTPNSRRLPARAASSPLLSLKTNSSSTPSTPMRVLVVDDNRLLRQIHKRMVEQAGFPCDVASSALQALEMVQKHSYSLILMDLMMEGMDGWSGAKAIRQKMLQTVGYSGIPKIVAATGLHIDSKLIDECTEAGMDDIIHKPVSPAVLTKLLNRYAGQIPV